MAASFYKRGVYHDKIKKPKELEGSYDNILPNIDFRLGMQEPFITAIVVVIIVVIIVVGHQSSRHPISLDLLALGVFQKAQEWTRTTTICCTNQAFVVVVHGPVIRMAEQGKLVGPCVHG